MTQSADRDRPSKRSRVAGLGHYVPERIVRNLDLEKRLGVSSADMQKRTGVLERRYVEPGTSCSDLAFEATLNALKAAKIEAAELDFIVLATLSPDHFFPGSACFLQQRLGLPGIPVLDVAST